MDNDAIIKALDPAHKRWSERRFFAAHTIDIIVRKDGKEYHYEGDFLKDIAREIAPRVAGIAVLTDDRLPVGVVRLEPARRS